MEPDDTASVLVAVINRVRDLEVARAEGWYRIPQVHAPPRLAADYLALYQTAAFGAERWAVRYYAAVKRYRIATRRELLPAEPNHPRADARYYQLDLGPLQALPLPLPARRLRRITFIATSFGQLRRASDVAELWHPPEESAALADAVWAAGIAGKTVW